MRNGKTFSFPVQHGDAMVLGVTHRYRSKYVTVVMYKPRDIVDGGQQHSAERGKKR